MNPPLPRETLRKMLDSREHDFIRTALYVTPPAAIAVYEAFRAGEENGVRRVTDARRLQSLLDIHIAAALLTDTLKPHALLVRETPLRKFQGALEWWGTHGWHALIFVSHKELPPAMLRWPAAANTLVVEEGGLVPPRVVVVLTRGNGQQAQRMGPEHAFLGAYARPTDIPDLCWWCDTPTRGTLRCTRCHQATYCSRACRLSDRDGHRADCGRGFCCSDCRRAARSLA